MRSSRHEVRVEPRLNGYDSEGMCSDCKPRFVVGTINGDATRMVVEVTRSITSAKLVALKKAICRLKDSCRQPAQRPRWQNDCCLKEVGDWTWLVFA